MKTKYWILCFSIFLLNCATKDLKKESTHEIKPKDILDNYSEIETEMIYSTSVSDSFKIFKSVPKDDSTKNLALVLILDANAYFESVRAEYKLATLTQSFPNAILVGIGYKNFNTMDSLRERDYTYPKDSTDYKIGISGGGVKFKKFINDELLPKLKKEFLFDDNQTTILGHSLGGYFVLYYMLSSLESRDFKIKNFIAASPSLYYGNKYILGLEERLSQSKNDLPARLYLSMGTLERDPASNENVFLGFNNQLNSHHYNRAKTKFDEYNNFEHMDAAMPGFIKGLIFVFEK